MAGTVPGGMPIDINSQPIQVLAPSTTVADDIDGSSDRTALPSGATPGQVIRVAASQDCYINFGDVTVTAAATNILMPAGVETFKVPVGASYIAYVQVSTAGRLSVSLMA